MRRTVTLCRTGLAAVATAVLLTACGGGDGSSSASGSGPAASTASGSAASTSSGSAASTSSSAASGSAAGSEFCTQASAVVSQLGEVVNVQDPAQLAPALQQAASQLRAIEAPPEIATDWDALVGAVDQLAGAAASTDFSNQQQAATFAQTATQLQAQVAGSSTKVENYLTGQCGIDTTQSAPPESPAPGSSAPSS